MITNLIGRYAIFEELYLREQTKATDILKPAIVKLYASMLTFLAEAKLYYAQKTGVRIVKSTLYISQRDMVKLGEDIREGRIAIDEVARLIDAELLRIAGQDIKAASSNANQHNKDMRKALGQLATPIQRVNDQLDGLVKNLERTEKLGVLGWISKMPYTQHHETVRKGRLENSGLWLFDQPDYVKWRKSRSSSLIWLHGMRECANRRFCCCPNTKILIAGSGKSNLVYVVFYSNSRFKYLNILPRLLTNL
jgi:hypothetical protein